MSNWMYHSVMRLSDFYSFFVVSILIGEITFNVKTLSFSCTQREASMSVKENTFVKFIDWTTSVSFYFPFLSQSFFWRVWNNWYSFLKNHLIFQHMRLFDFSRFQLTSKCAVSTNPTCAHTTHIYELWAFGFGFHYAIHEREREKKITSTEQLS